MEEKYIPPVKDVEPDDPMELNGVALPGDTMDAMAECFIEEYAMMGYVEDVMLKFFKDPFFVALNNVYKERGEEYVKRMISDVYDRIGKFRFKTEVKNG